MALDLHDLLMFFGSEAKVDESDVPWEYSGAIITFESGSDDVWCRLAPGEGEISLVWRENERKRVELFLQGYFEMKIENRSGVDALVALPSDANQLPFVLQLQPHVFLALGAV